MDRAERRRMEVVAGVNDQTYAEAEDAAMRRQAELIGADFGIDLKVRAVLSDELGFLRRNPAHVDDPVVWNGGQINDDGTVELTMILGWGCDHEAAILLGRLAERGWRLVRLEAEV